ncbi:MAG: ATP-dependent zinc protease [Pseudomonas sp.]|uniref:retropepsin-like aspartic peptidase RloA2 n=1 Tax=Pseudomonas sp. TaxID=306 RepID=UPI000CAA84C4|nr:ATP-dependent zinc protease [Pseudomonas sp.]PJI48335.1 MAG: ATP-dependent zinc protease [Pseudomonas sp.]
MKRALALLSLTALILPGLALAAETKIYGRYEWVSLPELDQTLQAKMDTGAYTSSLSAKDIQIFQRDGEDWVRFKLATKDGGDSVYEHKLSRISKIKNRSETGTEDEEEEASPGLSQRPVIELPVCLGGDQRTIEVNLTDRSHFNYPFLMGTKGLRKFHVAVDPGERFVAGKPDCS